MIGVKLGGRPEESGIAAMEECQHYQFATPS